MTTKKVPFTKKVLNYVGRRVDLSTGRFFYGNTAGLKHNFNGNLDRSQNKVKIKNLVNDSRVNTLKNDGILPLGTPYDEKLISLLQSKYNKMIEDDKYSFVKFQHEGKVYSRMLYMAFKNFREVGELLTDDIKNLIKGRYQSNFQVTHVMCWRNYYAPAETLGGKEIFSNRWHCDHTNTSSEKLFVNLSNVTENDGPFHIVSIPRTRELVKMGFGDRQNYGLDKSVLEDPAHVVKAVGPAGSALLCNTELCFHRADIPAEGHTRDLIQFKFVPSKEPLPDDWLDRIEGNNREIDPQNNPANT